MNIENRLDGFRAKRIRVFANGIADSFGHLLLINPAKERTWNKILNHVTQRLTPAWGTVYHLKSLDGKDSIHSFSELVHDARYVACGREQLKPIAGGYLTESEHNRTLKNKCLRLYVKRDTDNSENRAKFWALQQAQKNRRTIMYVFANGRKHQKPAKFVLIEADLREWSRTLNYISNTLDLLEGIQYLYTMFGQQVCGPCELQHGACYVAVPCREKFIALDYMANYSEFVLTKSKSGEAIKQFRIGPISSPTGLELRNDDCFHQKQKTTGKDRNAPTAQQVPSLISGGSKPSISTVSPSKAGSSKTAGRFPLATRHHPHAVPTRIDEVKVEEIGTKIVAVNRHSQNSNISTQTFDGASSKSPRASKKPLPLVVGTSECGLRVIGMDEVLKAELKKGLLSGITPVTGKRGSVVQESHTKAIQKKLSQLSQMPDDKMSLRKTRESVVSFGARSFMNVKPTREDQEADDEIDSTIAYEMLTDKRTPCVEKAMCLIPCKSVSILDSPQIHRIGQLEPSGGDSQADSQPVTFSIKSLIYESDQESDSLADPEETTTADPETDPDLLGEQGSYLKAPSSHESDEKGSILFDALEFGEDPNENINGLNPSIEELEAIVTSVNNSHADKATVGCASNHHLNRTKQWFGSFQSPAPFLADDPGGKSEKLMDSESNQSLFLASQDCGEINSNASSFPDNKPSPADEPVGSSISDKQKFLSFCSCSLGKQPLFKSDDRPTKQEELTYKALDEGANAKEIQTDGYFPFEDRQSKMRYYVLQTFVPPNSLQPEQNPPFQERPRRKKGLNCFKSKES